MKNFESKIRVLIALVTACISCMSVAQDIEPIEVSLSPDHRDLDSAGQVVVQGDLVYVVKSGVQVFRMAANGTLSFIGKIEKIWISGAQLDVVDGIAFISSFRLGLFVIDFTDPAKPRIIGRHVFWTTSGNTDSPTGFVAHTDTLCLVSGDILDVSDPTNIRHVGTMPIGNSIEPTTIPNTIVLGVEENQFLYDVSNPQSPVSVAEFSGGFYLGEYLVRQEDGQLIFLDISNPTTPAELHRITAPAGQKAGSGGNIIVFRNGDLLTFIDFSDPENPTLVATHEGQLKANGDHSDAFVVEMEDETTGEHIWEIIPFDNPTVSRSYVFSRSSPRNPTGIFDVDEGIILASAGDQLKIIDTTDPDDWQEEVYGSELFGELEFVISDIEIAGAYAFVVGSTSGTLNFDPGDFKLKVLRKQGPTTYTLVATHDSGDLRDITIHGDLATLHHENRIELIDISNPETPLRLSEILIPISTSSTLTSVVRLENVLIVGVSDGLHSFDISNASNPIPISVHREWAYPVAIVEGMISVGIPNGYYPPDRAVFLDFANPAEPTVLGPSLVGEAFTMGDHVIIGKNIEVRLGPNLTSNYIVDRWALPEIVILGRTESPVMAVESGAGSTTGRIYTFGPTIYEGFRPSNPQTVGRTGSFPGLDESARALEYGWNKIQTSGHYAFVRVRGQQLAIVDLSVPEEPVVIDQLGDLQRLDTIEDFDVNRDTMVVLDAQEGLIILNVSDPANPTMLGSLPVTSGSWIALIEGEKWVYVGTTAGTKVIDISTPSTPVERAQITEPRFYPNTIKDDLLYSIDYWGLKILDVSNPLAPTSVGSIGLGSDGGSHVQVIGTTAYVYTTSDFDMDPFPGDGLSIIDVSDPTRPRWVGGHFVLDDWTNFTGVVVADGFAYLTGGPLKVVDLRDPTSTELVGFNGTFNGHAITEYGDYLLAVDPSQGIIVLNKFAMLRIGPAFVRPEDELIRLPIKGVNVKRALIQRSTDMVTWEDWKTMDLEDNTCEAVDLITGQPQYFYRAVEAESTAPEN